MAFAAETRSIRKAILMQIEKTHRKSFTTVRNKKSCRNLITQSRAAQNMIYEAFSPVYYVYSDLFSRTVNVLCSSRFETDIIHHWALLMRYVTANAIQTPLRVQYCCRARKYMYLCVTHSLALEFRGSSRILAPKNSAGELSRE